MPARLLLIDDDTELTRLLGELLTHEGFTVDTYAGGPEAADRALRGEYSLIVLDVMLPDVNGFEVLKQIRKSSNVPVILLTARGDEVDRVVGLEIGADDYVPKPFNARELVARIRAVLRRLEPRPADGDRRRIGVDDVTLDPASRSVQRDGEGVELTTIEFDILQHLLESAGRTVSREDMAEHVLGRRFDPFDRSIDMHISKLRRKLGERPGGDERIKTIRGVGYIYTLPPRAR